MPSEMMKIVYRFLAFISIFVVSSCSSKKQINSFYVFENGVEIFRLSLREEQSKELQDILISLDDYSEKSWAVLPLWDISIDGETFSDYLLVGKDVSGKRIFQTPLMNRIPFSVHYIGVSDIDIDTDSSTCVYPYPSKLNPMKKFKVPSILSYDIERFFSSAEKKKIKIRGLHKKEFVE